MARKTSVRETRSIAALKRDAKRACPEHMLHVDWNEKLDCWEVADEEGRVVGYCPDASEATNLAVREAQKACCRGNDIIVCVQQPDGAHVVAWSSV